MTAGRFAVIVDPFSTGALIAPQLRERGVGCAAVISSPELPADLIRSGRRDDFGVWLAADDRVETTAAAVAALNPLCVIPGNESAVALAEALAQQLGLPGNDPATTAWRRDKYAMIERLRACGLRAAAQTQARNAAEVATWREDRGVDWPIVLKPLDSAGSDGVAICRDEDDVKTAAAQILALRNVCGRMNKSLLAQSYLDGPEFVVNAVLRGGEAMVCDVLESRKRRLNGSPLVYDFYRLVPPDSADAKALIPYTLACLKALDFSNGAAHAEVKATAAGPTLIEVGARAMGPKGATTMAALGSGRDMIAYLIDALMDGTAHRAAAGRSYGYATAVMMSFLAARCDRAPDHAALSRALSEIESVRLLEFAFGPGGPVPATTNLSTVLGRVTLANADEAALARDHVALRRVESEYAGPF